MVNLLEALKRCREIQSAVIRRMNKNAGSPHGIDQRIVALIDFEQRLSEAVAHRGARLDEKVFSYLDISAYIWAEIREISQQIWQEESEKLSG